MFSSSSLWPSASAIIAMGDYERGSLLEALERRQGEILAFFGDPDNHPTSAGWHECAWEEVEIADAIQIVRQLGWRIYGEPE